MTLPPDFPRDLAAALGENVEPPRITVLAPITPAIRAALAESRKTKGASH